MDFSPRQDEPDRYVVVRVFLLGGLIILLAWGLFFVIPDQLEGGRAQPDRQQPPIPARTPDPGSTVSVERCLEHLRTAGTDLQRDLANGVFQEGDPLEKLTARYKPNGRMTLPQKHPQTGDVLLFFRPPA